MPGRQLQLPEHGGNVRLDSLCRDSEARGDLLIEVAAGDVAQHLPLARRELLEIGIDLDRRGLRESVLGRMERHGGRAEIHTSPGAGTEVELVMGG